MTGRESTSPVRTCFAKPATTSRPCRDATMRCSTSPSPALLARGVTAGSHKGVITEFNRVFVKPGLVSAGHGRAFGQAFEKRQLGDYEFRRVITAADAVEIEQNAVDFVSGIASLLQP